MVGSNWKQVWDEEAPLKDGLAEIQPTIENVYEPHDIAQCGLKKITNSKKSTNASLKVCNII